MLEFYLLNPKPNKNGEKKTDANTKKLQRKTVQVAIAGMVLDSETKKAIAGVKVKITPVLITKIWVKEIKKAIDEVDTQNLEDETKKAIVGLKETISQIFDDETKKAIKAKKAIDGLKETISQILEDETKKAIKAKKAIDEIKETITQISPTDLTKNYFDTFVSLKGLQYGSQWQNMTNRPDIAITASDGSFFFSNLSSGYYELVASKLGSGTRYEKKEVPVYISPPVKIKVKIDEPKEINLEKSDIYNEEIDIIPTKIQDIFLSPTGIKGKITDEQNQPILNAKVQIQGSREIAFSDKEGNYSLLGLLASKSDKDKYTLIVSANGYQKKNSQPLELKQGEIILDQNFPLKTN